MYLCRTKKIYMSFTIRAIEREDLPDLKNVLDSIELFPSSMLDAMIANYLDHDTSRDIWFTAISDDRPVALGFCAPEQMTVGTFNLYAIGIHKDYQSQGIGQQMMHYIEEVLRQRGQRVLLVETSGTPEFARTREFYRQCQYHQEATIRDFYDEGDDKVVFWKKLAD